MYENGFYDTFSCWPNSTMLGAQLLCTTNDQRNRAATVDVDFNFRVIRRSGSRNCSPRCRYRCVVRLAAQFNGWIGPCLFPPQSLSASIERVRYSDTDANNDDHDTGPMHGNKEETVTRIVDYHSFTRCFVNNVAVRPTFQREADA